MAEATPGVGVVLGAAGAAPEIRSGGKTYTVAHPTQRAKARLEKIVKAAALNEVRELKGVLDPAAYQEAFAEAVKSLPDYKTWGPGWQRVVFNPANGHLHLWSLLQEHHPDADEALALELSRGAPEEVAAALAQTLPDFFQMLLAEVEDKLPPETAAEVRGALAELRTRLAPTPPTTAA